jgi:hypothetical protein
LGGCVDDWVGVVSVGAGVGVVGDQRLAHGVGGQSSGQPLTRIAALSPSCARGRPTAPGRPRCESPGLATHTRKCCLPAHAPALPIRPSSGTRGPNPGRRPAHTPHLPPALPPAPTAWPDRRTPHARRPALRRVPSVRGGAGVPLCRRPRPRPTGPPRVTRTRGPLAAVHEWPRGARTRVLNSV